MAQTLLMPKATAVWLVDNTALSFDQIAQFCKLHPLEVKAIADGEAAQGIKGLDPIATGQLSRDEIARAEKDVNHKLKLSEPKVRVPDSKRRGPRYTPVSKRQDRPNAILWLVRNHPELKDAQISRLVNQVDDRADPRPHLELDQPDADGSGHARPLQPDRSRHTSGKGLEGPAAAATARRTNDPAGGERHRTSQPRLP
jgi:hypothetical protein